MKNNKVPDSDEILNEYIKKTKQQPMPMYVSYLNKILSNGILPQKWSEGCILPNYKKSDKTDTKNYRPITLLSCMSKLITSILIIID